MVGKTYRLTQDMKDAAAALELPLAGTALTLKQIYADAPGQGAVVWQLGSRGHHGHLGAYRRELCVIRIISVKQL